MLFFLLGLLMGAGVAAAFGQLYVHRRLTGLCQDLALIRARLRSLVRLAEAGFLEPTSVEAASALNDLHHLVMVQDARAAHEIDQSPADPGELDQTPEAIPPIFHR
jgi:hypothetical protein